VLTRDQEAKAKEGIRTIDTSNSKEEILYKIQDLLEARPFNSGESEPDDLSPREKTILRLVSLGYTNKHIAEELFLSAHTVITHRKNISHKLGIKSVSALTVYAIVNNIITIEEVNF
jgi:DNA-binding NarL/FixJ family response regulator